jgi:tetratricopeptide (TPR) repeat protein
MAAKISNIAELFHRFHACELYVKQGKIAACLISFKEICERMPAIPMTDKEKKELHAGIEVFLNNLSAHKKFKEIFGEFSFGDTDLATNLEFIKSMIAAQEEEIVQKVENDEKAAEAQRLEIIKAEENKREEINRKIQGAIVLIDEANMSQALEIINNNEEIMEGIILHYNTLGMGNREAKNFGEAVQNYSKALSISPKDENLHYNIARAYFEEGKRDKAEIFLDKALKINPEFNEGKVFYEYLLKIDQVTTGGNSGSGKKSGGFFNKLFSAKKIISPAVNKISKLFKTMISRLFKNAYSIPKS